MLHCKVKGEMVCAWRTNNAHMLPMPAVMCCDMMLMCYLCFQCGQCNCNCSCQVPECESINCLCFELKLKDPPDLDEDDY